MGTWSVISATSIPKGLEELFDECLGHNYSPIKGLFTTTSKTLSSQQTVDEFAMALGEIANKWRTVCESSPIQFSLICDETDPIIVIMKPASFEVILANKEDQRHIEAYRCYIEGTPEWQARKDEIARNKAAQRATPDGKLLWPRMKAPID